MRLSCGLWTAASAGWVLGPNVGGRWQLSRAAKLQLDVAGPRGPKSYAGTIGHLQFDLRTVWQIFDLFGDVAKYRHKE